MLRFVIPGALILAAACAANAALPQRGGDRSEEAKIARQLAGMTPGKPQDCLPRDRYNGMEGYSTTILFIGGPKKIWRNELIGACTGLSRDDLPVITSPSGRMCRGDRVETRSRIGGMMTSACALGSFVPYSK